MFFYWSNFHYLPPAGIFLYERTVDYRSMVFPSSIIKHAYNKRKKKEEKNKYKSTNSLSIPHHRKEFRNHKQIKVASLSKRKVARFMRETKVLILVKKSEKTWGLRMERSARSILAKHNVQGEDTKETGNLHGVATCNSS